MKVGYLDIAIGIIPVQDWSYNSFLSIVDERCLNMAFNADDIKIGVGNCLFLRSYVLRSAFVISQFSLGAPTNGLACRIVLNRQRPHQPWETAKNKERDALCAALL